MITRIEALNFRCLRHGNRLASWDGGVWASAANRAGWGMNTKEYDPASRLTYMYQRWYGFAFGGDLSS